MNICKQYIISGRVQGVCYRISTQQQAVKLNLTGYVKNLADGRVKAEFCGTAENIEAMHQWLWLGPVMAKVEDIQVCALPVTDYSRFEVR